MVARPSSSRHTRWAADSVQYMRFCESKAIPFGYTSGRSIRNSPVPPEPSAKRRPGARLSGAKRSSCSVPESVNHSRPSGPKARSFGPASSYPPMLEASSSTEPSAFTRWMPATALSSPLPGTLPPWVT